METPTDSKIQLARELCVFNIRNRCICNLGVKCMEFQLQFCQIAKENNSELRAGPLLQFDLIGNSPKKVGFCNAVLQNLHCAEDKENIVLFEFMLQDIIFLKNNLSILGKARNQEHLLPQRKWRQVEAFCISMSQMCHSPWWRQSWSHLLLHDAWRLCCSEIFRDVECRRKCRCRNQDHRQSWHGELYFDKTKKKLFHGRKASMDENLVDKTTPKQDFTFLIFSLWCSMAFPGSAIDVTASKTLSPVGIPWSTNTTPNADPWPTVFWLVRCSFAMLDAS